MSFYYLFLLFFAPTLTMAAKGSGLCMEELFGGFPLTCVANDVRIIKFVVANDTDVVSCQDGEIVTAHLFAHVVSGATTRYDVGFVVALDGGNGLSGDCDNFNMDPVSVDNTDLDLLSGFGPFYNGELGTADVCGDIRQVDGLNVVDLGNVTFLCQDSNGDGLADVAGGAAWSNQASMGTILKPHCLGPDDAGPGTPAKCRFSPQPIFNITCNDTTVALLDDYAETWKNEPVVINVTENDMFFDDPPDYNTLSVIQGPFDGMATIFNAMMGQILYQPDTDFMGLDTFVYFLCNTCVPAVCKNATVYVRVLATTTGEPTTGEPTTTTPVVNGESRNDWIIPVSIASGLGFIILIALCIWRPVPACDYFHASNDQIVHSTYLYKQPNTTRMQPYHVRHRVVLKDRITVRYKGL